MMMRSVRVPGSVWRRAKAGSRPSMPYWLVGVIASGWSSEPMETAIYEALKQLLLPREAD